MLSPLPVEIQIVPTSKVRETWPMLQRAFRKVQGVALGDTIDEVAIVDGLCEGSVELHVATRGGDVLGGIILQYIERPKGLCCIVVVSLFNEFPNRGFPTWSVQMNDYLSTYAKDARGCYTIEAFARDGVIKTLEKLGWRRKATVMEMM